MSSKKMQGVTLWLLVFTAIVGGMTEVWSSSGTWLLCGWIIALLAALSALVYRATRQQDASTDEPTRTDTYDLVRKMADRRSFDYHDPALSHIAVLTRENVDLQSRLGKERIEHQIAKNEIKELELIARQLRLQIETRDERIERREAALAALLEAIEHLPGVHNPETALGGTVDAVRAVMHANS